jgi:hypothetical protein
MPDSVLRRHGYRQQDAVLFVLELYKSATMLDSTQARQSVEGGKRCSATL